MKFNPVQYSVLFETFAQGLFDLGFVPFGRDYQRGKWKKKVIAEVITIHYNSGSFASSCFIAPSSNGFSPLVGLSGNFRKEGLECGWGIAVTLPPFNELVDSLLDAPISYHFYWFGSEGGLMSTIVEKAGGDFSDSRILPEDDQAGAAQILLDSLRQYGLPLVSIKRSESEILEQTIQCELDKTKVLICFLYSQQFAKAKILLKEMITARKECIRLYSEPFYRMTSDEVEKRFVETKTIVPQTFIGKVQRVCDEQNLDILFSPKN